MKIGRDTIREPYSQKVEVTYTQAPDPRSSASEAKHATSRGVLATTRLSCLLLMIQSSGSALKASSAVRAAGSVFVATCSVTALSTVLWEPTKTRRSVVSERLLNQLNKCHNYLLT